MLELTVSRRSNLSSPEVVPVPSYGGLAALRPIKGRRCQALDTRTGRVINTCPTLRYGQLLRRGLPSPAVVQVPYFRREMDGFGALDATVGTRELQEMLRKLGFCEAGAIDGLWGPNTNGALVAFTDQRRAGVAMIAFQAGVDWEAPFRASTVRIDSRLLRKLRLDSAGLTDECAMIPNREPRPRTPTPQLDPESTGYEADSGSIWSNPWLWAGVAAVAAVGFYAYKRMDDGDMMMSPPRL